MRRDTAQWLRGCGIECTAERTAWAASILEHQPASTVHAMSVALTAETGHDDYLQLVGRVLNRGVPLHLVAGERSAGDWDVPASVRRAAVSYTEIPDAGHLMMLEQPDAFCGIVEGIVAR